jgi:hypothetical protein
MAQMDSVFGMVSQSYPIFSNGMDQSGTVYVCEKGLVIKHGGESIRAPFDYVRNLMKVSDMPLGKIGVKMEVYDQVGNRYDLAFGINDTHYNSLKKMCPKS